MLPRQVCVDAQLDELRRVLVRLKVAVLKRHVGLQSGAGAGGRTRDRQLVCRTRAPLKPAAAPANSAEEEGRSSTLDPPTCSRAAKSVRPDTACSTVDRSCLRFSAASLRSASMPLAAGGGREGSVRRFEGPPNHLLVSTPARECVHFVPAGRPQPERAPAAAAHNGAEWGRRRWGRAATYASGSSSPPA